MSRSIRFNNLPNFATRLELVSKLTIDNRQLFVLEQDTILVPFNFEAPHNDNILAKTKNTTILFKLRPFQQELANNILKVLQSTDNPSVLITLYCGAGKTVIILWVLAVLDFEVVIIVPRIILIKQWQDRIKNFFPNLKYKIFTPLQLCKLNVTSVQTDVVVLDEVHQLFTTNGCNAILKCVPKYLLGATATPWSVSGTSLFDLFFNKHLNFSRPPVNAQLKVIKTGMRPPLETCAATNKLDWNKVLTWQGECKERNDLVIKICKTHPTPQLILVKRLTAAAILHAALPNSVIIDEKNITPDNDIQYIIGTFAKLGTGFDHASLKTLVLAGDVVEYFEQYAGRILRKENSTVLFIDIVDNCVPLFNHFKERQKLYKSLNCKAFNLCDFE